MDLTGETVTRYRTPSKNAYGDVVLLSRGQVLSPQQLPEFVIETDDLLG